MDRRDFCTTALALPLVFSSAAHAALEANKHYAELKPAQPTDSGGKIEVSEFFSYACPHCHDFEPLLSEWVKKLPADVEFRRVPVAFNRQAWAVLAKLHFALAAIGEEARLHVAAFEAMHVKNINLSDEKAQFEWVAAQGVDRKKYADAYASFGVQSKVMRAQDMSRNYRIEGVPTIAVDGKYVALNRAVTSYGELLAIVDELVAKARAERRGKAPARK